MTLIGSGMDIILYITGLKIATDTVANVTNIFCLVTKHSGWLPLRQPDFSVI